MPQSTTVAAPSTPAGSSLARWVSLVLLGIAAVFFAFHFLHLTADFPNHSPWSDWSKYTDEGWYGDAAIRHYLSGHWYFPGDFNPAAALPIWPTLELLLFKFTGVSVTAARSLTLGVFGLTLLVLYRLIARHTRPRSGHSGPPLASALTVFFLCTSPFLFVFERMAILEPLLICMTALAILAASHLHPLHLPRSFSLRFALSVLPAFWLTLLLPAMVLTKTTAIFLLPAVFYMVWARAGYRFRPALRLAVPPFVGGVGLWLAYYFFFVRPHYLEDYRYLFSANAYTGIALEPLAKVVLNTIADGLWMGHVLYSCFFAALAVMLFWRPRLIANPLIPSFLLWIGGYFAFLAYHNNLQPRYYLVLAVPITVVVALVLDELRYPTALSHTEQPTPSRLRSTLYALPTVLLALVIALPDVLQQVDFLRHPTYEFQAAAQSIKSLVLADPAHPPLILSISGSDLTLMTGLPSIDDDFGTLDLAKRVAKYRPGWYVAWNELDDDKADALTPLYRIERVAAFPALDDPDRNLLILYRLDPSVHTAVPRPRKRPTPKPLITKLGQQPSTNQLEH